MSNGSFYFDPSCDGLAVFLGPTEARLMEIAWAHGAVTVKKALFYLGDNGSSRQAYTTIMTILARLAEKGLLERAKNGRSFVYQPGVTKEAFIADRVAKVRACLERNFPGR